MTTLRLHNQSPQSIVAVQGKLEARDGREYLPMDLCWIETGAERTIAPGASLDIVCAQRAGATEQQRAFVVGDPGRFRVEWTPRYVKLADGSEYQAPP